MEFPPLPFLDVEAFNCEVSPCLAQELAVTATSELFARVTASPAVHSLAQRLEQGGVLPCAGVSAAAQPFLAALLHQLFPRRPIVVVTDGLKSQEWVHQDLTTWLQVSGSKLQVATGRRQCRPMRERRDVWTLLRTGMSASPELVRSLRASSNIAGRGGTEGTERLTAGLQQWPKLTPGSVLKEPVVYMQTASVSLLRQDFARVLAWIEAGEAVAITKRGQPV